MDTKKLVLTNQFNVQFQVFKLINFVSVCYKALNIVLLNAQISITRSLGGKILQILRPFDAKNFKYLHEFYQKNP